MIVSMYIFAHDSPDHAMEIAHTTSNNNALLIVATVVMLTITFAALALYFKKPKTKE